MGLFSKFFGPKQVENLEEWLRIRVAYIVASELPEEIRGRLQRNLSPEIFSRAMSQVLPLRFALFSVYFFQEIDANDKEPQDLLESYFQDEAYSFFRKVQNLSEEEAQLAIERLAQETRYYFQFLASHAKEAEDHGLNLYHLCFEKFIERTLGSKPIREEGKLLGVESCLLFEFARSTFDLDKKWIWKGKAIHQAIEGLKT